MITSDLVARAVAQIRKSRANYEYFFEKLDSPEWLEPLQKEGFFTSPPEPRREGQSISFPGWPESRYLARMAGVVSAADVVYSIASKIPPTENVRVNNDLAEIALALPPHLGARFVAAAKKWAVSPYQLLLPEQLGRLVQHLAVSGKIEAAIDLARTVLELVTASDAAGEVRPHFDEWAYSKILRENIPSLVEADGCRALLMFCDLLDSALQISHEKTGEGASEDYSYIWRPAIEDHSQNRDSSAKNALVEAVRDAAEQVVRQDPESLPRIVGELESRRWKVFRRVALHLIERFVEHAASLAEARVADRAAFDDIGVRHEYYHLLRAAFSVLSENAKQRILEYIEQGPDMEVAAGWLRDALKHEPSESELLRYKRAWQLKYLSAAKHALPQEWRERYQQWSEQYGEPEHPDFVSFHWSGWVGPSSPKKADELRSLTPEQLVGYLNSWEPSGRWDEPSREGLANELQALVVSNPGPYVEAALRFRALRPIFLRAFVMGLRGAASQGKPLEWAGVLELLKWIVNQETGLVEEAAPEPGAEDRDLSWTKKAVADFISDALAHQDREPPYALRRDVWSVLAPLADSADPTPEHERRYGPPNMDPFTLSLNTTRGQALHGVVNYLWWVGRHTEIERMDPRRLLAMCPEAQELLERHLRPDRDPSLAIRSVYGQAVPALAYFDLAWVQAHVAEIFPARAEQSALWEAAWNAYVVFCNPQRPLLQLLRSSYERAVQSLSGHSVGRQGRDPAERLSEHLLTFYWCGEIDLASDNLLQKFFAIASDDLREHAIRFVGHSLSEGEPPPPEVLHRLKLLWESRVEVAETRPLDHVEELSAFGEWFGSGRFDDEWALKNLRAVLRLARKIDRGDKVVERLAHLANTRPLDAVEAFEQVVDVDTQGWLLPLVREDAERLLRVALARDDSRERATDVLHRLGARGYSEFRRILVSSNDTRNG